MEEMSVFHGSTSPITAKSRQTNTFRFRNGTLGPDGTIDKTATVTLKGARHLHYSIHCQSM